MRKSWLLLAVLLILVMAVSGVAYRVGKTVGIKSDFKSRPTFYKQKLVLMDDGNMLFIGKSAQWDKPYLYFYDLVRMRRVRKRVPLEQFFRSNRSLLINRALIKRTRSRTVNTFYPQAVHFYDSKRALCGIEVRNYPRFRGEERRFLLFWDLKNNRIKKAILLSKGKAYSYYSYHGGYDSAAGVYYYVRTEPAGAPDIRMNTGSSGSGDSDRDSDRGGDGDNGRDGDRDGDRDNGRDSDGNRDSDNDGDGGRDSDDDDAMRMKKSGIMKVGYRTRSKRKNVAVYAISASSIRKISRFRTNNRLNKIYFDRKRKRLLVTEYTEKHYRRKAYAYLVNLKQKRMTKLTCPTTPYGADFSADGRIVYIASAQSGWIWAIHIASGRVVKKGYGWTHGHALGFIKPGTLVWVRNASLVFFNAKTLRRTRIVRTSAFYRGFCHVEGSLVVPGKIILKNGSKFRVVRF